MGGFAANITRRFRYFDELDRKFKGKSAKDKDLGECQRCGRCCHIKPCALSKEDLGRLARARGMPPSEFFRKFCVVDTIEKAPLTVLPRREGQEHLAGRWVPDHHTWDTDPCVFWDPAKGCGVYADRPKSARAAFCNDDRDRPPIVPEWDRKSLEALGWDGLKDDEDDYEDPPED